MKMSTTSKTAWKNFERAVAKTWGSFRVPLSGINSRHNAGDVILPNGVKALIECKLRGNSVHYTLFKLAQKDALKNGIDADNTLLYLKVKATHDYLVTMTGDMFEKIMQTEARKLFDDDDFR